MSEQGEKMKEIGLKVKEAKAANLKVAQMIKKLCEKDIEHFTFEPDVLCDRCIEICLAAEVDCEYMIELKENHSPDLSKCCYIFLNACVV